jgi:hypothetical protein
VRFGCLSGTLVVHRRDGGYVVDLPARLSHPVAAPRDLAQALGAEPTEVRDDAHNYIAVFDTPAQVQALDPDMVSLRTLDRSGVIATAAGHSPHDFTSRYFAPLKAFWKTRSPAARTARWCRSGPTDWPSRFCARSKHPLGVARWSAETEATASNCTANA